MSSSLRSRFSSIYVALSPDIFLCQHPLLFISSIHCNEDIHYSQSYTMVVCHFLWLSIFIDRVKQVFISTHLLDRDNPLSVCLHKRDIHYNWSCNWRNLWSWIVLFKTPNIFSIQRGGLYANNDTRQRMNVLGVMRYSFTHWRPTGQWEKGSVKICITYNQKTNNDRYKYCTSLLKQKMTLSWVQCFLYLNYWLQNKTEM